MRGARALRTAAPAPAPAAAPAPFVPAPSSTPPAERLAVSPRVDEESLARALYERLSAITSVATPDKEVERMLARIQDAWRNVDVVSFDVFDTLLVRRVKGPKDVFLFLANRAPFDALKKAPLEIARLRMAAEDKTRQAGHAARGSGEVTLTEIYTTFCQQNGLSNALVKAMVEAERDVERAVCVVHPVLHGIYRQAKASGKTVWFVSDTYHEGEFLRELLTQTGYDGANGNVVASCDRRASKGNGSLWEHVIPKGMDRRRILHIGDHALSDGSLAERAGVRAVVHPLASCGPAHEIAAEPAHALVRGLAAVATKAVHPAPDYWWRLGYEHAGPLMTGFALWLADRFRADKIDRAYFLLRDGEIMRRVFEIVTAGTSTAPHSLLHSSRRAMVLPALEAGGSSVTSQLFVTITTKPVRSFLERMRVSLDGLDGALRRAGFTSWDEPVSRGDHVAGTKLLSLYRDPLVADRLIKRSQAERVPLVAYLRDQKVFGSGRVAFVDVGWNGSIQKALRKTARLAKQTLDEVGYYLASAPGIDSDDEPGMKSHGYLFDRGAPHEHMNAVNRFRELIEFVCTSTRGGLLGFEMRDGKSVPIEQTPEIDDAQRARLTAMHEGIVAYAHDFMGTRAQLGVTSVSSAIAGETLMKVIISPSAEDATHLGALRHDEGMGTSLAQEMAAFRAGPASITSVLEDLQAAYWKEGMKALPDHRTLLLRTACWLTGN